MTRFKIEGKVYVMMLEEEYLNGTSYKRDEAKKAISALTCSEFDGAKHLFKKLENTDTLVVSKLADEVGVAKSLMTLMLKKLESCNIIELNNMGRKGTRIKLLNNNFREMISKI